MTDYESGSAGQMARAADFFRLRGRLVASPFHFINLGVLAYIGMGQVRKLFLPTRWACRSGQAGRLRWKGR